MHQIAVIAVRLLTVVLARLLLIYAVIDFMSLRQPPEIQFELFDRCVRVNGPRNIVSEYDREIL